MLDDDLLFVSDTSETQSTRRDFLKNSATLVALALSGLGCDGEEPDSKRVLEKLEPNLEHRASMKLNHIGGSLLADGENLHAIGGYNLWFDSEGPTIAKHEVYYPGINEWKIQEVEMPDALKNMACFVWNGGIYTVGGERKPSISDVEIMVKSSFRYDLEKGKWNTLDSFEHHNIARAKVAISNSTPFLLGGILEDDRTSPRGSPNHNVYRYNANGRWEKDGELNPVGDNGIVKAVAAVGDEIYVFSSRYDKIQRRPLCELQVYNTKTHESKKRDFRDDFNQFYAFTDNKTLRLWACGTETDYDTYEKRYTTEPAIHLDSPGKGWSTTPVPRPSADLSHYAQFTLLKDYMYLVGRDFGGWQGKLTFRFKLPANREG